MPAPSQLVFTHFPDDPDWQLLERPIDLEEFESLVPLKPTFFKYGLHLLSHTNAVIRCPAGRDVSVRIECPKKKVNTVCNCNCLVQIDVICYLAVESTRMKSRNHTVYRHFGPRTLRTQDTSDLGHFGPRTLRHQCRNVRKTLRHWYRSVRTLRH